MNKQLKNDPKVTKSMDTPSLWMAHIGNLRFQLMALGLILFLPFCVKYITYTLSTIDQQVGRQLFDPIHAILPAAIDLSNIIFFFTYLSVFIVLIDAIRRAPIQLLRLGYAIGIMKLFRSYTMVEFPLEPPEGIIALQDPIVSFMTPNNVVALRDLFFSGHCATMIILYLVAVSPRVKKWMKAMLFLVPALILFQRVHYTVDVVAGLLIGAIIYQIVKRFIRMKPNFIQSFV